MGRRGMSAGRSRSGPRRPGSNEKEARKKGRWIVDRDAKREDAWGAEATRPIGVGVDPARRRETGGARPARRRKALRVAGRPRAKHRASRVKSRAEKTRKIPPPDCAKRRFVSYWWAGRKAFGMGGRRIAGRVQNAAAADEAVDVRSRKTFTFLCTCT
jgi:hypothetical protein